MTARGGLEAVERLGQPVMNRCRPRRFRERRPLCVAHRDEPPLRERPIERMRLREIEAAVQGDEGGSRDTPREGETQVVGMAVNDVELARALINLEEHPEVEGDSVDGLLAEPQPAP